MRKLRPLFLLCSLFLTTFYLSLNAQELNYDFDLAFEGKVIEDGSGFTMELVAERGEVEGWYLMTGSKQKVTVRGTYTEQGELKLNVTDADGNVSGGITARFINGNQMLGTWQPVGQGSMNNFVLVPTVDAEPFSPDMESDLIGGGSGSSMGWNNTLSNPVENTFELKTPTTLAPTTMEWSEESHDFGKIPEGDKVSHTFTFRNTGNNPLKIETVKPSCGCTTPDWTKDEIAPGETGMIKVEFDSKGKIGMQRKSVTVIANTSPKAKVLSFSGEVISE